MDEWDHFCILFQDIGTFDWDRDEEQFFFFNNLMFFACRAQIEGARC